MEQTPGIVTPEAVVLEFETAGMASRMLAALIDTVIQAVALFTVLFALFGANEVGLRLGGWATALFYFLLFLLVFGYPAAFETLWRGRTPGKAAMGLRVVTAEGGPARFRHAAIRSILGLVDKYALSAVPGVLALLVTRRNQRLGDLVAGTLVLRERSGARAPQAVVFSAPAGLGPYVDSLDVARLTQDEYVAVRSFLLRAATLRPGVRDGLARQLATPLLTRLQTTAPGGVTAEVFLACVAAAHQQRAAPPPSAPAFESVWATPSPPAGPPSAARASAPSTTPTGFVAPG